MYHVEQLKLTPSVHQLFFVQAYSAFLQSERLLLVRLMFLFSCLRARTGRSPRAFVLLRLSGATAFRSTVTGYPVVITLCPSPPSGWAWDDMADEAHMQLSCLHLSFYLASWGMFRGSSFLLEKSAKFFEPLVRTISSIDAKVSHTFDFNGTETKRRYTKSKIIDMIGFFGRR
jgi:hypothetical protein